jgi:hypothetical protein
MNTGDRERAITYGEADAFGGAGADVAGGQDAGSRSKAREQLVIVSVRSDKKPEHDIAPDASDCAVVIIYSDGPEVLVPREFFKFQAGVMGIIVEQAIRITNLAPDREGQLG